MVVHNLELLPVCRCLVGQGGDAVGFGKERGLTGFQRFAAGVSIAGGVAHLQSHGVEDRRFGLEDGIFDAGRAVEPEILGVFAENLVVEGIDAADEGIGFVFCEGVLGHGFIEDDFALVMVKRIANGSEDNLFKRAAGSGTGGVEDGIVGWCRFI